MPGAGCPNSASGGGASLVGSGAPVLAADTLVLTASGEPSTALSVVSQGDATIAPVTFGDGLRCVGGDLKRLYVVAASSGTVIAPPPAAPAVSARSAALGDPLLPGTSRSYYVYYRDPVVGHCPPATFNATNALRVVWQ